MTDQLEKTNITYDTIVLGSGPAGLTASIYAVRGGANVLVLHGPDPGGQLVLTQHIENYPGIVDSGFGLIEKMQKQAKDQGVEIKTGIAKSVVKEKDIFKVDCGNDVYYSKSVIVATGSKAKWLEIPGEEKFKGEYISTCATCDGFAFRNKTIAVVGGGNTAAEDAIYLSKLAKKVYLIHRRDTMRAEKVLQDKLFKLDNVEFLWNSRVSAILGSEKLESLKVESVDEKFESYNLEVEGLFEAIGHTPNTSFLNGLLPLTPDGYIDTKSVLTSIPGLLVAGDVMDPFDRQAVTAAAYGCMAGRKVLEFLND